MEITRIKISRRKSKSWLILTLLGSIVGILLMARMADADVVVRPSERRALVSRPHLLAQRLLHLESQVSLLRQQVHNLEERGNVLVEPWTCYVETPFDGVFVSTRPTQTEAMAIAIAKCTKKSGKTLSCRENRVKCGQ